MTPAANCRQYQRHRRQILPRVLCVLLTPVANLPLVSTIPAANLPPVANCHRFNDTGGKLATGVIDTGGK
jgi:hypothetical protein